LDHFIPGGRLWGRNFAGTLVVLATMGASCPALADDWSSDKALETFDQVWEKVRDTHFDYGEIEQRWGEAREELRPGAAEAADNQALRKLLTELLGRVGSSHYAIVEASVMEHGLDRADPPRKGGRGPGATGMTVRVVEGRVRIVRVDPDSPAARAGLEPGQVIRSVDEVELDERIERVEGMEPGLSRRWSESFLEAGLNDWLGRPSAGSTIAVVLEEQDGSTRDLELTADSVDSTPVRLGNLPPLNFNFQSDTLNRNGSCVGYLRFSTWVPALTARVADVMPGFGECAGVVVDLRGNPGGVAGMIMPVAAYFVDEPTLLGTMISPEGKLEFRALPRRVEMDGTRVKPFSGPLAVIVDGLTASTSEMFAAGIQATGRGRVFGSPTPGMALPAMLETLPSGDRLMYAFADYVDPDGNRVEGAGVQPDEPIALTASTLRAGQDGPLEAAIEWIQESEQ